MFNPNQISFIIGGDVAPTKENYSDFIDGNIDNILDESVQNLLNQADFRIINLEVPLTDDKYPIKKSGPNLFCPKEAVNGIKKINPSLVCLANNHILDHGDIGIKQTIETLEENNLQYMGAGLNLQDISKTFIFEKNNKKIGIYNCAEHEYNIATKDSAGANPYEPLDSFDEVQELSSKVDYTIVIFHGGREYYKYPTPQLQKICRKFIDKGADFITCQHTHCIGAKETYKNCDILYGQGNFIFKGQIKAEWQTGLLVKLTIEDKLNVEYIPLDLSGKITIAGSDLSQEIIQTFNNRSNEILEDNFVIENFTKEAKKALKGYMNFFANFQKYPMHNVINCESHREIFLCGLKNEEINKDDFILKQSCNKGQNKDTHHVINILGIKIKIRK